MAEFKKVDTDGTISYYNEKGQLHRDGDKPAIVRLHSNSKVYSDGELITDHDILYKITSCDLEYWVNGELHRDGDEPAVIWKNGSKEYWVNGKPHRDGGKPAIISLDGTKEYYVNGLRHRDGDKPAVIYSDGSKYYYVNNVLYFPSESKKQKPKSVWEKMKMLFNIR